MTDSTALQPYESELLTQAQQAGVDLRAMLDAIPEADDDAYVRLITQLANATSVEDLDKPWSLTGLNDYEGQWLRVDSLRRMPSDFTEGLGFYLIVTAMLYQTGEIITCSTGSVNVVTQLVKAHSLGALPVNVRPMLSSKPTKDGYRPMHLEFEHPNRRATK